MANPSFTPGPWGAGGTSNIGEGPRQNVWSPIPPGMQSGTIIASNVRPADAALISAAPDLYAALGALIEECRLGGGCDGEDPNCDGCIAVKAGQAALAKAVTP